MLRPNGHGSYILDVNLVGGGRGEIIVDSGAEESVCPKAWAQKFGTTNSFRKMIFRGANGNVINHYGERKIEFISPF